MLPRLALLGLLACSLALAPPSEFARRRAFLRSRHPRKDYRRLKKQEGAVKLVGGERGAFEGKSTVLGDFDF